MTVRTQWDEAVDEAIEQLIADETEAFVLATVEDEDVHLVKATEEIEQSLLSIYVTIEQIRLTTEQVGVPMSPGEILAAAAIVAEDRGLARDGV